jgi:hypothetical protein
MTLQQQLQQKETSMGELWHCSSSSYNNVNKDKRAALQSSRVHIGSLPMPGCRWLRWHVYIGLTLLIADMFLALVGARPIALISS